MLSPLSDNSVDTVVNIFAPESLNEFSRVLNADGRYITAVPLERHLSSLKKAVYANPYLNPAPLTEKEGIGLLSAKEIKYSINLKSNEDIRNLFLMTPHYYKTSREDQQKLKGLSELTVEAEFLVLEYKTI